MAILRRDDWLTTPQGQALAGAEVWYLTQPADTSSYPPSPLASVSSDLEGTPEANPQHTDGYGHAVAYLDNSQFYTIAFYHPLLGANPLVLKDQNVGQNSSAISPIEGVPTGTIDGTNRVFELPRVMSQVTIWCNYPLIPGLGYTLSGTTITFATAPQPASGGTPADNLFYQGY